MYMWYAQEWEPLLPYFGGHMLLVGRSEEGKWESKVGSESERINI